MFKDRTKLYYRQKKKEREKKIIKFHHSLQYEINVRRIKFYFEMTNIILFIFVLKP